MHRLLSHILTYKLYVIFSFDGEPAPSHRQYHMAARFFPFPQSYSALLDKFGGVV